MTSKSEVIDAAPTLLCRNCQAQSTGHVVPAANTRDVIEGFRLELPRGGWVQFRSALEVSGGTRNRIVADVRQLTMRAQSGKATDREYAEVSDDVTTRLLRAIVEAWSYDVPLPVPRDALDRLPAIVVDEVNAIAGEYIKRLVLMRRRDPGLGDRPHSWLPSLPPFARRTAVQNLAFAVAGALFACLLLTVPQLRH